MRILLLFPMADRQTGPAIKYAFEQLGHEVMAVDAKLEPGNSHAASLAFNPDLVFCSRTKALTDQVMLIKKAFPKAVASVWNIDTRYSIERWEHLFPLIKAVDYYFVIESNLFKEWRELNVNTYWLSQGLQIEIYDKPHEITNEDRQRYVCDVCFCGTANWTRRSDRMPFLEAVEQAGFKLNRWGRGSEREKIYNEEHNKAVSLSKINLCISGHPNNEKNVSLRNYKILGAGGFALELYRKGIHEVFPAEVLHCYRTPEELVEKVRYWLDHEEERKEVAERGYKWVHENATYTHRMKTALEIMGL